MFAKTSEVKVMRDPVHGYVHVQDQLLPFPYISVMSGNDIRPGLFSLFLIPHIDHAHTAYLSRIQNLTDQYGIRDLTILSAHRSVHNNLRILKLK